MRVNPFFLLGIIALWTGCLVSAPARASTPQEAQHYAQGLGNQALAIIANNERAKEQKRAQLERLFSQSVDIPWIGRFVMGRFWRQATQEQKNRYLRQYEKFLLRHYTERFADYSGGSFTITGVKAEEKDEFTVSMTIQSDEPQGEPVLVDYRLRHEAAGFKIFDIIVEGVSMIATQRSEFSSVAGNRGIDYLIDKLGSMGDTLPDKKSQP